MRANARPFTRVWLPTATASSAMSVPAKSAFAPMAPAPLTCQNTRDAWAPPVSTTWLPAAMAMAPPTWKTKTAFGLPAPSRVTVPAFDTAPAMVCSPGAMVVPASAPSSTPPPVRPATSLYAATRSACACAAAALPTSTAPVTTPGGKPVGCVFALTPRSPRSVVWGVAGALTVLPMEAPLNTA